MEGAQEEHIQENSEEKFHEPNGIVQWDEEFHSVCTLSGCKENVFYPWEIMFTVLNGLTPGPKNKVSIIGTAYLNLADYAKDFELQIPLMVPCGPHGAMSFDTMWDEINDDLDLSPRVYIVSWNDHFFVLKVDQEAFYIIDTLGERLFEGCNKAYILKFDRNTTIYRIPVSDSQEQRLDEDLVDESLKKADEFEVFCNGKECCKEYIKNFLAAIPIRELEAYCF